VPTCYFGGTGGIELTFEDPGDLVVIRTRRRGARHDVSPLSRRTREAQAQLGPLFGFSAAGVGVYDAPPGGAEELATVLNEDPEVQFAGRGLRDQFGAPVVYTENLFVKFEDGVEHAEAERTVAQLELSVKRSLEYASGAYFLEAPEGTGQDVFPRAEELLSRDNVQLCHPEVLRQLARRAFSEQWHLAATEVNETTIDAHANVAAAWEGSEGQGTVIAIIDDGMDIDHREFSGPDRITAPHSFSGLRSDDPRPGEGDNHGTACAGVAGAAGSFGASGVAPKSRLMPLRMVSGLGSQDEADAFVWAADSGADVISCSWGPRDGRWWDPDDPVHQAQVPLPDNTRLALDYATNEGRGGRGCVITWAAGNGSESVDNDGYASYQRVVAVAACNDQGSRSAYSDYGRAIWCCFPSSHGEPSLTPGIWTTDRSGHEGYNSGNSSLGDPEGDFTNSFGGTSSACPGVAGVAALVLAVAPDLAWGGVKDILRQSCDRIDEASGRYDADGHSAFYGYGRINAATAVELAKSA
jgi:subtilisin family serine protease